MTDADDELHEPEGLLAAVGMSMRRVLLLVASALFAFDVLIVRGPVDLGGLALGWRLTTFAWPEPSLIGLWYATGVLVFLHVQGWIAKERSYRPLLLLVPALLLGSLLILPYEAFRGVARARHSRPPMLAARWLRGVLYVELLAFSAYGLLAGNLSALWQDVSTRWFSHFLFVDFCVLLALLFSKASGTAADAPPEAASA